MLLLLMLGIYEGLDNPQKTLRKLLGFRSVMQCCRRKLIKTSKIGQLLRFSNPQYLSDECQDEEEEAFSSLLYYMDQSTEAEK